MTSTETLTAPHGANDAVEATVTRPRAPRRDKGVPRHHPAPPSQLTQQQATEIKRLSLAAADAMLKLASAELALKRASCDLESYLGALQAGEAK